MVSFQGAEIFKLVGLYILTILKKENIFSGSNFGIYGYDLAVVDILLRPDMKRKYKQLRNVFNNIGFYVTTETNQFVTDFLDVTLDLQNKSHKLLRKPNARRVYVNSKSNHPEHVLKHIPVAANNRLRKISSSQSIFKETTQHYKEAIRASGCDHGLARNNKHEWNKNKKKREEIYYISMLHSTKAD